MAVELADLNETTFAERLVASSPVPLDREAVARMYEHYRELRRWNRRVALVGSGLAERVVERLFAESVAALPLLDEATRTLVDVGSGAGFPGLVLAAARPEIEVTLVEPRERKWAFLRSAAARASLTCVCLNARVAAALPEGMPDRVDRVTVRALRLGSTEMKALAERLTEVGSFLSWSSDGFEPEGFRRSRAVDLGEGRGFILELKQLS